MTSDMGEMFNTMKAGKRALRAKFGLACPRCQKLQPRRNPTILLPGQRCKVDGYVDYRNRITKEQENQCYQEAGIDLVHK